APEPAAARAFTFAAASLLVDGTAAGGTSRTPYADGKDPLRAAALLDSVVKDDPRHVPALRTLESIARASNDLPALAQALSRQGDALQDVRARLGALWALASLEEWKLPAADPGPTYARVLELDAADPGALEATLRRDLPLARRGDPRARKSV